MQIYSFEKLDVWHCSKKFTADIYKVTAKFPSDERFVLVSQLRRSSISICSNIAEGSGRKSYLEKSRFTTIAYSSGIETMNQLAIALELGFVDIQIYEELRSQFDIIARKLSALHKYQISIHNKQKLNNSNP